MDINCFWASRALKDLSVPIACKHHSQTLACKVCLAQVKNNDECLYIHFIAHVTICSTRIRL